MFTFWGTGMEKTDRVFIPGLVILALLLIWEIIVRVFRIPLYLLPAPTKIVVALIDNRKGLRSMRHS